MSGPGQLLVTRVHHIGVLVRDLDEAARFYTGIVGFSGGERHESAENDVHAILLDLGDLHLEIFAPLSPDGPVARNLEKRGPGMHHIAYEVGDIEAALESCRAAGIQLIDERPRPGLHAGWRVAFLHPRSCGGVLTELIETDSPWQGTGL